MSKLSTYEIKKKIKKKIKKIKKSEKYREITPSQLKKLKKLNKLKIKLKMLKNVPQTETISKFKSKKDSDEKKRSGKLVRRSRKSVRRSRKSVRRSRKAVRRSGKSVRRSRKAVRRSGRSIRRRSRKAVRRRSVRRRSGKSVRRRSGKSVRRSIRRSRRSRKVNKKVASPESLSKSPINNVINLYIKMMSGDIIPLEVNSDNDILVIKEMIKEEKKEIENMYEIKLFNMEGDELNDTDKIKDKLENEDMINLIINISEDPPFKGQKWIHFNTTDKEVESKHYKKANPVLKRNGWMMCSGTKRYEGNLDEFIKLPGVSSEGDKKFFTISSQQINHLKRFRQTIKDLGYDDLIYVYAVYSGRNTDINFISTNYNSSIVYEYEKHHIDSNSYIYINGVKLRLISEWFKFSDEQRLELLRM